MFVVLDMRDHRTSVGFIVFNEFRERESCKARTNFEHSLPLGLAESQVRFWHLRGLCIVMQSEREPFQT